MERSLMMLGAACCTRILRFPSRDPNRPDDNALTQSRQNGPVVPLGLPVRLRVVRRREHVRYAQYLAYVLEKLGRQLLPVVGQ